MNNFKRLMSVFVTLVIMFGIFSISIVPADAATVAVPYTGERKLNFNSDWRFRLLDTARNVNNTLDATAGAINFDDSVSNWSDVELPHDWSIYQAYGSGTQRAAQGALPGGTGWYRKSFTLPDDFKGKTITIQFDGVQMVSEMWVNGVRNTAVWKQYLGYVTFEYDITSHLLFDGQKNTIAIKCYSSSQSARWYPGAGIYRNVWLIVTNKVNVPVNGVAITTPASGLVPTFPRFTPIVNPTSAQVDIKTKLTNDNASGSATVSLKSTVYDKAGDVVSAQSDNISIAAGAVVTASQTVNVPNPKLWSVDSPNLYWVRTEVISGGTVIDTVDSRFGIRYLDVSSNTGYYINGTRMQLNGMCEHSDLGPLGMEVYQAAIDRRIRKLKDMGCNSIRTAHNPVSPEFIEACDRLGMTLMEEAFDQWARSKNGDDYSNYFSRSTTDGTTAVFTVSTGSANVTINRTDLTSNAERDVKAMVDRDKNSPAVIIWSTGNEIDDHKYTYSPNLSAMINNWIHSIDTTRPTICVPPWWDNASGQYSNYMRSMNAADIGGFNYATDYYSRGHGDYPNLPLVGAETCSAFATRGYYAPEYYGVRVPSNRGSTQMCNEYPGETNFELANKSFTGVRDNTFILGEYVWTGHDYLGEPTPHGGNAMSSSFGVIDTCGFEKDAFYLYRSNWSDMPTCRLLPQNWTSWTPGQSIPVVVYTNGRSVDLYLNDVIIGTRTFNKATANPVYVEFGGIPYAPGELKAIAKDISGNVIATDVVYSAGAATNVDLVADRAFIKNDGRDLVFIEATIRDSAGIMVPTADNRVTVSVTGGRVIAVGNGSHIDRESQRGRNDRRAFFGKCLFIIAANKGYNGNITITSTASGLTSNTVVVSAVPESQVGDGTIVLDYEKPEVSTGIGIPPTLPDKFRVMLDNGLMQELLVRSWNLGAVNLNQVGTYTAYGSSDGFADTIEAIVHVKEFTAAQDIYITSIAGVYPPLPKFVTINYSDGEIGAAPVTWDPIDPLQYAGINTFTVQGKLGLAITINAHVTVKVIESVQDITVYTTVGRAPDMPAGVPVKFNDGSVETMPADWSAIKISDYAYPGETKVFGNLLGSSIKVTAKLVVRYLVYLSDLDWVSATGTVVKDRTVGGNTLGARGVFGGPPVEYRKGLGTRAPSEIVYDISGMGYDVFEAYLSLSMDDGGMTGRGAVAFEVYLDGVLAFESGTMDRQSEAILVSLDVTGVSTLKIASKAVGNDGPQYDLADWCDAKFFSSNIAVGPVTLAKQIYTNNTNSIPSLPATAQATVAGVGTGTFKIAWPPLTTSMFSSAGVVPIYGRLEGTANGVALVKIITNYNSARTTSNFLQRVGTWSEFEKFDWSSIAVDAKPNLSTLTLPPKLIFAQNNLLVENVQKYGFEYGVYPISNSATNTTNTITFATPGLTYFQLLNVASTTTISSNSSFTIATSPDNSTYTTYTGFTKSGLISGTGTDSVWARRTYTSNSAIPSGTNFLRVTFPSSTNTWQFNITNATFRGGANNDYYSNDLAFFRVAGYDGVINQDARTVTVTVPKGIDLKSITPEVYVSPGATYSPAGLQDFTDPVTYSVSGSGGTKVYTVSVSRGHEVTFDLDFGNIGGDPMDVKQLVADNGRATAPTSPTKDGYSFGGWSATLRGTTAVNLANRAITADTTFYAIWTKSSRFELTSNADAGLKTWQGEKTQNFGTAGNMLLRQSSNTTSHGLFGQSFTSTSTTDSTDIKTGLVRFDISEVKGFNVKSATLALYYAGSENGTAQTNITVSVARASSTWTETQVTWTNYGRAFYVSEGTATSASFASSSARVVPDINVLSIYNRVPTAENAVTFALTVNHSGRDYQITTKEGAVANPSRAPRLILEIDPTPDYNVFYNLNGVVGTAPREDVKEAGMKFVAAAAPGPLFKEWNTQADGEGTSYSPGEIITMPAANLTLYAMWNEAQAIIAAYNDKGAMISVGQYVPDAKGYPSADAVSALVDLGAASIKAFLWDDDYIPLVAAMEVYKK